MRRLWDISQTLTSDLPVWPGDTAFASRRTWDMAAGSPVNVSAFEASTHAGTHADAPLHYAVGGPSAADLELDVYLGPCRLVDARGAGPAIDAAFVRALGALPPRVLFRTYERFPHGAWRSDFVVVTAGAIAALAAAGVRLIGIDSPSLDPEDSKTMDAHHAVLSADLRILEGLVLDEAPPGDYELIALPLKLAGLDAAPVRAVLRELAL
ncbi:arylformamidase [Caulobacter sp. KR2-114]|uniref:arylformamidase n=1 Tax=Caulobacter sp. KR2-114 TaxID=3400912 RepID=UPI003BFFBCA0